MLAFSLLSAIALFYWIYRASRARPAFLFAGIFLIWQSVLKILATLYLDFFGPVMAPEVGVEVGGKGASTPLLAAFLFLPLLVMYAFMAPSKKSRPPLPERAGDAAVSFADVAVWFLWLFVAVLYVDMLRIGTIPFFAGIERFNYEGGVFHEFLFDHIWLVAFFLGLVIARARIATGDWDLRCLTLLFALFCYLFLTGHRFGAFYVTLSFIALALAGVFFAEQQGWPVAPLRQNSQLQRIVRSPLFVGTVAAIGIGIIALAMINSLFVVRGYGSMASDALEQRLLVQPVELYWLTWDRWTGGEVIDGAEALDFMFNDPLDAARNTGIQYLMFLYLGQDAAMQAFVYGGQDYAGGYPEILIELGGVWVAALAALAIAIVNGILYRLCVESVARGHFLTAITSLYLAYGLLSIYLGGMLNLLVAWTYWVKMGSLVLAFALDKLFERAGHRVFPWVVVSKGRTTAPAPRAS
jgi:hypothetical protein